MVGGGFDREVFTTRALSLYVCILFHLWPQLCGDNERRNFRVLICILHKRHLSTIRETHKDWPWSALLLKGCSDKDGRAFQRQGGHLQRHCWSHSLASRLVNNAFSFCFGFFLQQVTIFVYTIYILNPLNIEFQKIINVFMRRVAATARYIENGAHVFLCNNHSHL